MIILLFLIQICVAQEGIWKSLCSQSSDCLDHLVCQEGLCTPPNPPTAKQCGSLSFVHQDNFGKAISVCPPKCGFDEDIVLGPRCIINIQGCQLGKECRYKGYCGFNGIRCVRNEEGCAQSRECIQYGRCGFDGKKCVASQIGCSKSDLCTTEGICAYLPGPKDYEASHGNCVRSRTGCLQSQECTKLGKCGFENGLCVSNTQGCANSELCKIQGKCRYQKFVGCVQ